MKRPKWSVIFVFFVVATLLFLIRVQPSFPDPDSFYHAKMALMIRDQGFIHAFPWLQETVMRDQYVDAHWLYHVLLIPFVTIFDPLVGMRVSAVLFGLLAFYALYRFLKSVGSPYPEWLTLVGALSFDFLQRVSMPKAGSLSVAMTLFCAWAMLNRRPKTLFVASVLFVWLYHGWPVLVAILACLLAAEFVARRLVSSDIPSSPLLSKEGLGVVGALVLGILVGNVVNPYFPSSLAFSVTDILKNAVTGGADIPVGSEWYAQPWITMLQNEILAICLLGFSIVLLIPAGASRLFDLTSAKARTVFFLLFLMSLFGTFTFRSIRFMEYFVPFLLLTVGAILSVVEPFLRKEAILVSPHFQGGVRGWLSKTSNGLQATAEKPRASLVVLFLVVCVALGSHAAVGVDYAVSDNGYFSASQYEGSAKWMGENLAPGAIVFNPLWDSSMMYFYLDDAQYFLVGLDPRFMYDQDKDRYQAWFDLQAGTDADVSKIQTTFHASAVLVDRRLKTDFVKNLEASNLYDRKYEDKWTQIYVPKESL